VNPARCRRPSGSGHYDQCVLYGRIVQCALVDNLLADARAGRSGAMVLRGPAGIGKSALLAYAVDSATGMRVLRCTGIESESDLPFAGVHQLLLPILDRLEAIPARQRDALKGAFGLGPAVAEERFLVSLAVLNLLAEGPESEPLLCVVDDAQWLDGASGDALMFAARRIHAEGMAMLFAARDDPQREFGAPGVPEVPLSGLDRDAANSLLAERSAVPLPSEVADRLVADTLGNPLALAELVAALSDAQLSGRTPLPDLLPVTHGVERLFLDRVRRLPPDSQTLLLIAATQDSDDLSVVLRAARTLGIDPSTLDAAEKAELIWADPTTLRFRHPLIRSAVYRSATSEQRRAVTQALAAALDDAVDTDRRVWLLANAATEPDAALADALQQTAIRARGRSAHAAAAAYERAAVLTPDPDQRATRLLDAADAAWAAGQPRRARALLDQATPLAAVSLVRGRIEHLRGSIEGSCGAPEASYATLMVAVDLLAPADPAAATRALTEAAQMAWTAGDFDRLREVGERLRALGPDHAATTLGARVVAGLTNFLNGNTADAAQQLREAAELAEVADDPRGLMVAATGAMFIGDDRRAIDLYTRAVAAARAAAAASTLPMLLAPLSSLEAFSGRYSAALADATEGLRLAEDTGQANPAAHLRAVLAWLAAVQGREQDCRDAANQTLGHALGQRLGPQAAIAEWALALLDLGTGRRSDACDRLEILAAAGPGEGHRMVAMFAAADLVEAAVRSERSAAARAALERLTVWGEHTGTGWAKALAARCHGLVADADEQDSQFTKALELHASAGRPFDTARTELVYGESLRRRRRRADARKHLRAAHETFEQLGATPWADQARVELLATGETARRRDVDTLNQLTPQELQIARFVAQGTTNRAIAEQLFLSPRTVDYHLRKIFTKLGLTSRHQLMRFFAAESSARAASATSASNQDGIRSS
jgi:DNA-binding NarL/FixJ family response regulator